MTEVLPILATGVLGYLAWRNFTGMPGNGAGVTNVRGSSPQTDADIRADINTTAETVRETKSGRQFADNPKFPKPPAGQKPGAKIPHQAGRSDGTYMAVPPTGSFQPHNTPQDAMDEARNIHHNSAQWLNHNPVAVPFSRRGDAHGVLIPYDIRGRAQQQMASRPPAALVTIPFQSNAGPKRHITQTAVGSLVGKYVSEYYGTLNSMTIRATGVDRDSPHNSGSMFTQIKTGRLLKQLQ